MKSFLCYYFKNSAYYSLLFIYCHIFLFIYIFFLLIFQLIFPWFTQVYPVKKYCFSTRKQNKLNKYIETQKEKFTQLDLQDVEVREKIKHSKSKNKKLQKQLEKDKEKVCWLLNCGPLLHTVQWLHLTLYCCLLLSSSCDYFTLTVSHRAFTQCSEAHRLIICQESVIVAISS